VIDYDTTSQYALQKRDNHGAIKQPPHKNFARKGEYLALNRAFYHAEKPLPYVWLHFHQQQTNIRKEHHIFIATITKNHRNSNFIHLSINYVFYFSKYDV